MAKLVEKLNINAQILASLTCTLLKILGCSGHQYMSGCARNYKSCLRKQFEHIFHPTAYAVLTPIFKWTIHYIYLKSRIES